MKALFSVAEEFLQTGRVIDIREFGNGNINRTFLVSFVKKKDGSEKPGRFILQRINTQVFREPELVMRNTRLATTHILKKLAHGQFVRGGRWDVPRVLPARSGADYWIDSDGSFWRAQTFIEDAESFDTIKNALHAGEVGYALGLFHMFLSDLPSENLADTLPGFHITPGYLGRYEEVLLKYKAAKNSEVNYCMQFVNGRTALAHVLEDARARGRLRLQPIHGDPKINNILLDTSTGQAISIIDLDTLKPGLVHYDIGDCLRSGCNPAGEETTLLENVRFDPELCRAVLEGYFLAAREFLTPQDREYIYDSIRLISFELGLRFFTDYLEGNIYFKVRSPEHNLARALVQFRLAESIESQEKSIRAIIRELR